MKKTKLKKVSNADIPKLKKKLWGLFSAYIRKRDGGTCYTCGATGLDGHHYHAGHFIPKSVGGLALYFHEDNVHGQCVMCNMFLQGNAYEYGKKLGENKVAELYALKNRVSKWSAQDYLNLIEKYKQ
jgi:5-methylcytosine-specific restriction endonuclease McrA